jgi:hypothetical protein
MEGLGLAEDLDFSFGILLFSFFILLAVGSLFYLLSACGP